MAESISFDYSNAMFMVSEDDIAAMKERVLEAKKILLDRTGEGNDYLGWLDLLQKVCLNASIAALAPRQEPPIPITIKISESFWIFLAAALILENSSLS